MKIKTCLFFSFLFVAFFGTAFASSLLQYVPQDSFAIVTLEFSELMKNSDISELLGSFFEVTGEDHSEVYQHLGVNPLEDFETVVFFIDANDRPGFIVGGTFDNIRMSEVIEEEGFSESVVQENIAGFRVVSSPFAEDANTMFVDQKTLAFGSLPLLRKVAAVIKHGSASILNKPAFDGLYKKIKVGSQLWGVIIPSADWINRMSLPLGGIGDMLSGYFNVNYAEDFVFMFVGLVKDEEALERFVDGLDNTKAVLLAWAASIPQVQNIIERMGVLTNRENMGSIVLSMPSEQFKTALSEIIDTYSQDESEVECIEEADVDPSTY